MCELSLKGGAMQAAKVLYIDKKNERSFLEKRVRNIHFLQSEGDICDKIKAIEPNIIIVRNIVDRVDTCSYTDGIYLYIDPPRTIERKSGVIIFTKPKNLEYLRSKGYAFFF